MKKFGKYAGGILGGLLLLAAAFYGPFVHYANESFSQAVKSAGDTLGATPGIVEQWVRVSGSKLVRSLNDTQGTLITNTGATATTSAVALQVIGSQQVDNLTVTGTCTGCGVGSGGVASQFNVYNPQNIIAPTSTSAGFAVGGSTASSPFYVSAAGAVSVTNLTDSALATSSVVITDSTSKLMAISGGYYGQILVSTCQGSLGYSSCAPQFATPTTTQLYFPGIGMYANASTSTTTLDNFEDWKSGRWNHTSGGSMSIAGNNLTVTTPASNDTIATRTLWSAILQDMDMISFDVNFHGNTVTTAGDTPRLGFDQSGQKYILLNNFATNGADGWQHVSVPLSYFSSVGDGTPSTPGTGTALDPSKTLANFQLRVYDTVAGKTVSIRNVQIWNHTNWMYQDFTQPDWFVNATVKKGSSGFPLQSFDLMKYTKDNLASQFTDVQINQAINALLPLNPTHVSIFNYYDNPSSFPSPVAPGYAQRWGTAAHNAGLGVIWRGNYLAWEGDYSATKSNAAGLGSATSTIATNGSDNTSLSKFYNYVVAHKELYKPGDIITPFAEPENGGINGVTSCGSSVCQFATANDFRKFLRDAITVGNYALSKIGLRGQVGVGFFGNSGFITYGNAGNTHGFLDARTVDAMGIVTMDHYPNPFHALQQNLTDYERIYGQQALLWGEWGTTNQTNDLDRATTTDAFFNILKGKGYIKGLNYWVPFGGSNENLMNTSYAPTGAYYSVQREFTNGTPLVIASALATNNPGISVVVSSTTPPLAGQVLVAATTTSAYWRDLSVIASGINASPFNTYTGSPDILAPTNTAASLAVGGQSSSAPFYVTSGGALTVLSTSTLATTTASMVNGTIVVDGVHYPQTPIGVQNALNDCHNYTQVCEEVYAPPHNYSGITTPIFLPSDVSLSGAGSTTVFSLANNANINPFQNADTANGNQNIRVRNIKIDGNRANQSVINFALQLTLVNHFRIENVQITHSYGDGFSVTSSTDGVVFQSKVHDIGPPAIADGDAFIFRSSHDIHVTQNEADNYRGDGFNAKNGSYNIFFQGNHANGLGSNGTGSGFVCTNEGGTRSHDVVITGNIAENNFGRGILADRCDNVTIAGGNISKNNMLEGIGLSNTSNSFVGGNESYDDQAVHTQTYGLKIAGGSAVNNVIGINHYYGNVNGDVFDSSKSSFVMNVQATSTLRQLSITATSDIPLLAIKPASNTQTAPIFEIQNSTGSFLTDFTPSGSLYMQNNSSTGFLITKTDGSPVFVVDTAGTHVGIGTNDPSANMLHIVGDSGIRLQTTDAVAGTFAVRFADGTGGGTSETGLYFQASDKSLSVRDFSSSVNRFIFGQDGKATSTNDFVVGTSSLYVLTNALGNTRVGIGTNSPAANMLHIVGDSGIRLQTTSSTAGTFDLRFADGSGQGTSRIGLYYQAADKSLSIRDFQNSANRVLFGQGGAVTTTGYLVVGAANPTINMIAGDVLAGRATTTNLAVTSLTAVNCAVKTDTSGNFYCGTDATGGSSPWNVYLPSNTLAPTNTAVTVGIGNQNATSTLQVTGTVNIQGAATTSKLVVGSTNNPIINMVDGDLRAGRATTSNLTVTTLTSANCAVDADTSGNFFCANSQNGLTQFNAYTDPSGVSQLLSPTNTSASVAIGGQTQAGAKVYFDSSGNASTTGYLIVNATPTTNLASGDALFGGNATVTKSFIVGTSSLVVLNIGGNGLQKVGIGTASPATSLDIVGGTNNAEANLGFREAAGSGVIQTGVSLFADIDDDNNNTNANFVVRTNNGGTTLLTVTEAPSNGSTGGVTIAGNATTSGYLVVGTSNPTINMIAGDVLAGRATTTNLTVTTLNAASCDVKADTSGNLSCGIDATGGSGSSIIWNTYLNSYVAPTNTSALVAIGGTDSSAKIIFDGSTGNATTTNNLTVGTTTAGWYFQSDRQRLGVNTTTPQEILSVVDRTGGEADIGLYGFGGNGALFRGYTARGTIDAPSAVQTDDAIAGLAGNGYGATVFSGSSRGNIKIRASENWSDSAQGTYIAFNTTANTTVTTAEKMRIDNNGNVGIGSTAPTSSLTVLGNATFYTATTTGSLTVGQINPTTNLANGTIQASRLNLNLGASTFTTTNEAVYSGSTTGDVYIQGRGSTKIFIDSNNNTNEQFQVVGNGSSSVVFSVTDTGNATTTGYLVVGTSNPTINMLAGDVLALRATTTNLALLGEKSCSTGLQTDSSGNVFGCVASDARLKTDIHDLAYDPSFIQGLNPVSYQWIDPSRGTGEHIGFVAQQVQTVDPRAVVSAGGDYLGVDPNAVLAGVVNELKHLKTSQPSASTLPWYKNFANYWPLAFLVLFIKRKR